MNFAYQEQKRVTKTTVGARVLGSQPHDAELLEDSVDQIGQ